MNLTGPAFLKIAMSAAVGLALGWLVSLLLPAAAPTARHDPPTVPQICMAGGGLVGAALATVVLAVRDSRNAATPGASNFSQINGMGSRFIGRSDPGPDGSYLTTEWFCALWLPIIPICNYRLLNAKAGREPPGLFGSVPFTIQGKGPVRLKDVVRGYSQTAVAGVAIAAIVLVLRHVNT